jgi:hypothetical protein
VRDFGGLMFVGFAGLALLVTFVCGVIVWALAWPVFVPGSLTELAASVGHILSRFVAVGGFSFAIVAG